MLLDLHTDYHYIIYLIQFFPVFLVISIAVLILLILFLPVKGAGSFRYDPPSERFHEADTVLSRRLLIPGSEAYERYYRENPHLKKTDDHSRDSPGLLSGSSKYFQTETFAVSRANFGIIDHLGLLTHDSPKDLLLNREGNKLRTSLKVDPVKASRFITRWLKQSGAHRVGFTALKDYHLYSHKGRGIRSGNPIPYEHSNAIAITVEMDYAMMQPAPLGTSVMESSEQYLRSGILALKLASYIRELGYEATAHIDGNYEVICPLVAVDAGLGVIGRMGLLMTPVLGSRVRISVVTTDMPVAYSHSIPDRTTLHFCHLCRKCAVNCPAAAIPEGSRETIDGTKRWLINSEKCYHFWTVSGTDCGRCITVCPYSHRDDVFHRFIRWGIKNNLVFRYLAVKLDDVFYGQKPPVRPLPDWADMIEKP